MAKNKGEWSEIYALLYLLINNKLNIVDENLTVLNKNLFEVKKIFITQKKKHIIFIVVKDTIEVYINDKFITSLSKTEIKQYKEILLSAIKQKHSKKGAFDIQEMETFFEKIKTENIKASSKSKEDIALLNKDLIQQKEIYLTYSIKSQLGKSATILNASDSTNIRYKIYDLDKVNLKNINNINTKRKLIDRIQMIKTLGGKIVFDKIENKNFEYNLKMIDSLMPEAIADVLLKSYELNTKDLKYLFEISSIYTEKKLALKKLSDLLNASSFGMMPSKLWNGYNTVNGGIIIVCNNEEIYVLDLIYYPEKVNKYLVKETKLDSPSSSRYDMLHLKEDENGIYFTLNLQIRYI